MIQNFGRGCEALLNTVHGVIDKLLSFNLFVVENILSRAEIEL